MSKRTPHLLLEDILDAAEKIRQYLGSMTYEEFASDARTFDAVLRNLEIMGEAANSFRVNFESGIQKLSGTAL